MNITEQLELIIQAIRELRRELAEIEEKLDTPPPWDDNYQTDRPIDKKETRQNTFDDERPDLVKLNDEQDEYYQKKDRFFEPPELRRVDPMHEAGHSAKDFL